MCRYCENDFEDGLVLQLPGFKEVVWLVVSNGFLYVYCHNGQHEVAKINFCPICGDKLRE